ncbi:unnamed protein product [Allacma fusca]|uniref:Uncharacterized protein n=1 Tax=Allacma fusca TaxID=39272 RepID=A0A8J2PQ23_9HEXA|nr:unnamed protein product [Allacma fusca]
MHRGERTKSTPGREIREFASDLGIQLIENQLSKTPQVQFLVEKIQKYLQPQASPAMPSPPTKKKKRYEEPEQAQQFCRRSTGNVANGMSFEDVLKVGVQVARSYKAQYIKWLLPKDVEFAKAQLSRDCRPEINLLKFRVAYLKNLVNYINSPFPRFMFLPHEVTSPEIPKNEVIEKVAQVDSEISSMILKDAEDLSELHVNAKRGAEKIREISRPNEDDDIVGTEERMMQVQKELMKQIKLVLVDMKQGGKIRPRSQDFMTEVIKSGTVPREKTGEVDSHIVSTFVNEIQLLRLRKTGRGKYRLAMIDFNN